MNPTTIGSAVAALVADAIALAVSFSVNITTAQQAAILTFVGATTTAVVAVVAWLEGKKLGAAAAIAIANPQNVTDAQHAAAVGKALA